MLRVHQGTVDTYLEDIILQSIEKTADIQVSININFYYYCYTINIG